MSNTENLFIIFLIVILLALLFYQLLCLSSEESLVLSAVFIMLSTFASGLLGNVRYVYYLVIPMAVLGMVSFLLNISFERRREGTLFIRLLGFANPSVVCLVLVFVYTVIAFKGALFTYPDELSQWGPAVRHMTETGKLPYGDNFSGQALTFSTATLFQFFWTGMVPFIERNSLVGNFILTFIPVYLPLSGSKWKNWKGTVCYTLLIFLSFNVITYVKYYTLLQDFVLPMWAGGTIAWILWRREKELNWLIILGALMCISPMKSMVGPLFAGIILVVILIRQFIAYHPATVRDFINKRVLILTALISVSVLLINQIWSSLISQNVYDRFTSYDSTEKNVKDIIIGIINRAFISNTGNSKFPNINFTILFILVIVTTICLRRWIDDKQKKKLFSIVFSAYGFGFVIFLLIMLFAYSYVFGAEDSQLTAGLERYLSYYMLLVCVPLFSELCQPNRFKNGQSVWLLNIILLISMFLKVDDTFLSKVSTINQTSNTVYKLRTELKDDCEQIKTMTGESGKVYIWGTLSYTDSSIISWELGEQYQWNRDCYRLYARSIDGANIMCDIKKYPHLLRDKGYEYLWCYHIPSDPTIAFNYELNDYEEGAFYKVTYSEQSISLDYCGNTNDDK